MSNRTNSELAKVETIRIEIPNGKPARPLLARMLKHAYRPSECYHASGTSPVAAYFGTDEEIREWFPPFLVTDENREHVEGCVNMGQAQLISES